MSFDTQNPPRNIGAGGIFDYLREMLPGFESRLVDHGAGAVSLLAIRGSPRRLFNVHLDTVPSSPHWTSDPLVLRLDDGRAIGLGVCDIKGAAAALLAAAQTTRGDAALLFTTDEEANDPRCVSAFLATSHGFEEAIVAEPTGGLAITTHRGICSARLKFRGRAGHASGSDAMSHNALHHAMRWGARALELVDQMSDLEFGELRGLRFNIGKVEGGVKANVIAPEAEVRFGFRPLPSQSIDELHTRLRALVPSEALEIYEETFRGSPLPAKSEDSASRREDAEALANALGLPLGRAVDFWTEGALFSAAGLTTLVFGPGDIQRAHSADEWVSLDQLDAAASLYRRLLS